MSVVSKLEFHNSKIKIQKYIDKFKKMCMILSYSVNGLYIMSVFISCFFYRYICIWSVCSNIFAQNHISMPLCILANIFQKASISIIIIVMYLMHDIKLLYWWSRYGQVKDILWLRSSASYYAWYVCFVNNLGAVYKIKSSW